MGEYKYKKRIADSLLDLQLESAGAVLVEGPKWCGKTTTAEQKAKSVLFLDDPENIEQNLMLAETRPKAILEGKTPRLIDEWQLAPKLWDAARFEIDHRHEMGQFIFTGSAVPADTGKIIHTGTGRFSWLMMRPMSLWESEESTGEVSLKSLFEGDTDIFGKNDKKLEDIAYLICRGGWPGSINLRESPSLAIATNYYEAVVRRDISRVDGVSRDEQRVRRLMRSYARNQGSQAPYNTIADDISANEIEPLSSISVSDYVEALKKIFVIEDMKAWNPNLCSKTAIRSSDTRYFVDPSIAAAALELGPLNLMNDLRTMGLFFETMAVRDLRVYADALSGNVYHYRDKNNLECDAVVSLRGGRYGLIEIKVGGERLIEEGVKTLKQLESKIDTDKMNKPSFLMVLTATGQYAFRRPDGVLVVPIGCLKD